MKRTLSLLLVMVLLASACCMGSVTALAEQPITLKFPVHYAGTNPSAMLWTQIVADFEAANPDIKIEYEEVPGLEDLTNKVRTLAVANEMPDIVLFVGGNFLGDFQKAGLLTDLTPYLEADPELRAQYDDESLQLNSVDGKVYALPRSKSLIGYYYNKSLFEKAGIQEPAKTWPEFWENCEKLKAAGITPLSMDTNEAGWITSLMLGSIIGTSNEAGNQFMNTQCPKDYNLPEVIDAARTIQEAYAKYTTPDTIGAGYALAASHFLTEQTAMIFNGPWMAGDLQDPNQANEGLYERVEAAIFPDGGVYYAPFFGDMVGSKDKEHADAAVRFLKYFHSAAVQKKVLMASGDIPINPQVPIDDEVRSVQRLVADLYDQANGATWKFGDYGTLWYQNVQDTLTTSYPLLAAGKMSPEDFCKKLSEVASTNRD